MVHSLEIVCIWQRLRVFAFNPDADEGVESYQLGQVSKEFSPRVKMANYRIALQPCIGVNLQYCYIFSHKKPAMKIQESKP
jgi:hypothetical protein